MSLQEVYLDRQRLTLGRLVGKGGEGEVYALANDSSRAVKLYTAADLRTRELKVSAMVRANLAARSSLVAFPMSTVAARDGRFLGFVMRLVAGHKPLHELYSPGPRKHHFPRADYRFLVRAATNIARAVASVHAAGCVIGDINHSSILISNQATAALIDADSFQISDGTRSFPCQVGVPEYTPPELQGQSLANVLRTANHDAFGLAIVIFQLLFMGRHPFVGSVRRGETPALHEAIRDFRFVYAEGRDVGMDQPPGTPAISEFGKLLASAFEISFSKEHAHDRPTARKWVELLEGLERSLAQCKSNSLHFAPSDASECPWCAMEAEFGTYLFIPFGPDARIEIPTFDPGEAGFNLEAVWARIKAVQAPELQQLQPILSAVNVQPSAEAQRRIGGGISTGWLRSAAFIAALVIMLAVPKAWIIWIPLALYAFFSDNKRTQSSVDAALFTRRFWEIEERWGRELAAWRSRSGVSEYESLMLQLVNDRDIYRNLAAMEVAEVAKYHDARRKTQLEAYLDRFEIRSARIRGIGPAKEAALASFGIETAADVQLNRLLSVAGFGWSNSQGLIEWRSQLEKRFVYSETQNSTDWQELARIRNKINGLASNIRRNLTAGPQNLSRIRSKISATVKVVDPVLNRIHQEREQIRCDLKALGIPYPSAQPQPSVQQISYGSGQGRPSPSSHPPAPSTGVPNCPRCGSTMVRRTARRGRNAGGQFWGCPRFPRCKGTRS